ncbi:MAG: hypothetical protein ABSA45_07640 [Verrucomicrobiota bacterium]
MKEHSTFNIQRPTSNGAQAARPQAVGGQTPACFPDKLKFELQRARVYWMSGVSRFRLCGGVLLMTLAGCLFASAQSNGVPGPMDYSAFSRFITERNIFDPNRFARNSASARQTYTRQPRSVPTFTLVGTMSYEKGLFAFFDGNESSLRRVLYPSDTNSIAGFTLADITLAGVTLQTADGKQTVPMKIGEAMRQEGTSWQLAGQGGNYGGTSAGESAASVAADSSSTETSAASSSTLEGSDVLKRLMQQREKELK